MVRSELGFFRRLAIGLRYHQADLFHQGESLPSLRVSELVILHPYDPSLERRRAASAHGLAGKMGEGTSKQPPKTLHS